MAIMWIVMKTSIARVMQQATSHNGNTIQAKGSCVALRSPQVREVDVVLLKLDTVFLDAAIERYVGKLRIRC